MKVGGPRRRILFLQGLATPFFWKLGRRLEASGAEIHKIHICPGDALFWPHAGAVSFRGKPNDWPEYLDAYLKQHEITDIVLFGDCRFYHRIARRLARRRDIPVHVFDEGYLRPDWITMERDGANAYSRLPRTARAIQHRARATSKNARCLPTQGTFANRALWDIAFNTLNLFLWFTYPFYVRHRPYHPLREGLGWLKRLARSKDNAREADRTVRRLLASRQPYFLLPLQLDSDWQIRKHSSFRDMGEVLDLALASFKNHAPEATRLVVKVHPMDNGLIDRLAQARTKATLLGIAERVDIIDGGDLDLLLQHASGTVVVNSTVGLSAMRHGCPTIALGRAFYRMKRLTFEAGLDAFWTNAKAPDRVLVNDLLRILTSEALINGSYFSRTGIEIGVENAAARLGFGPVAESDLPTEDTVAGAIRISN